VRHLLAALVLLAVIAACSAPVGPVPSGTGPTPVPTGSAASAGPAGSAAPSPGDPTPIAATGEAQVTLGIYSGRPDPSWTLSGAEGAAVEQLIETLPPGFAMVMGGLGYRGFTVTSGVRTFVAYLGAVSVTIGSGPTTLRADPGRTVERLLLETGRLHLAASEIAEVERSLSAAP
jgi:hypothetical protein